MIVLASLLVAQLAPGCRQLERSLHCELAPPVRVAAPVARIADDVDPPRRERPRAAVRAASKPETSRAPPTPAEIAHHARLLVAIADCTGARTLLAATGDAAKADGIYRACVGLPAAPALPGSGRDLGAVPSETAAAGSRVEAVDHP